MDKKKRKKLNYKSINALKLIAFAFVFAGQIIPFKYSSAGDMRPVWSTLMELTYVGFGLAFTISGFLITAHIDREYKYHSNFKLFNFWGRRIFKIIPLYIIVLFLGFVAIPNLIDFLRLNDVSLPPAFPFISFTANFYMLDNAHHVPYFIAVLWPICVLLQVYFLWGIICKAFWKKAETIALTGAIVSVIVSIFFFAQGDDAYKLIVGCLSFFLWGAWGALQVRRKKAIIKAYRKIPPNAFTFIHIVTWSIALGVPFVFNGVLLHAIYLIVLPLFFVLIIWEQTFIKNTPIKLHKIKILDTIGTYSYGLYMFHGLAFGLTIVVYDTIAVQPNGFMIHVAFPFLCLLLTIFVSQFSYPVFEKPFIRMRRQFKRK